MAFEIRGFRVGDELGVCAVVKAVYDEYGFTWDPGGYHADLHDLEAAFGGEGFSFWVAEVDGVVVGCGGLARFDLIPGVAESVVPYGGELRVAGCDCEMLRLYVDPSARRLGMGRAFCLLAIEEARRHGRRLMELWSDKRFVDAHRLYFSLGARQVGERICDDPDESPEWGLALPLI